MRDFLSRILNQRRPQSKDANAAAWKGIAKGAVSTPEQGGSFGLDGDSRCPAGARLLVVLLQDFLLLLLGFVFRGAGSARQVTSQKHEERNFSL